jgi:tetratricopeptide (TPR) repeat protein
MLSALKSVILRICLAWFGILLLSACSTLPSQNAQAVRVNLFNDSLFPSADDYAIETPQSLFELSEQAKEFVDQAVSRGKSEERQVLGLIDKIFDRSDFDLLYRADANTNATQTFESRAANCLSLTIMTYAMAKHAGFNTKFQRIEIPEFWTRRSGYTLVNGHINIKVKPSVKVNSFDLFNRDLTIDFDPQDGLQNFRARELDKDTIVAMFYNNKAAELILKGELNHAYAYLRAALDVDHSFKGAMVNLGLVYRQAGDLELAQKAYLSAIAIDQGYLTAWENLATLYTRTERNQEADAIYKRLERERRSNPYYYMMLAEEAFDSARYKESIAHFKHAISLDDDPHQFYFGLAKAHFKLADYDTTKRYLGLAKRKARGTRVATEYGEKMSMLASFNSFD